MLIQNGASIARDHKNYKDMCERLKYYFKYYRLSNKRAPHIFDFEEVFQHAQK